MGNRMLQPILLGGKTWAFSNDRLIVRNVSTGKQKTIEIAHPSFDTLRGLAIRKIVPAPGNDGLLVLLEPAPQGYRTVGNLLYLNLDAEVVWWAELAETGMNNYVDLRVDGADIVAYSWNGYSCTIDLGTGKIAKREWVK